MEELEETTIAINLDWRIPRLTIKQSSGTVFRESPVNWYYGIHTEEGVEWLPDDVRRCLDAQSL